MAILNRLLLLLKFLETLVEFGDFLTTPVGIAGIFCLISYPAFTLMGCDPTAAAILASTAALTVHCTVNHPSD
ncbi:MAG: hypothetical protein ACFBSG_09365 [Leptolyngbyaceae cyanobacterium]